MQFCSVQKYNTYHVNRSSKRVFENTALTTRMCGVLLVYQAGPRVSEIFRQISDNKEDDDFVNKVAKTSFV